MFVMSESDSQFTASFVGKACGGTFTAGETLTATTDAPGQNVMELTGGATFTGGKCNGLRIDNAISATVSTTGAAAGATITLKHGRASGRGQLVYISTPCTLTRLAASSSPPPPPTSPLPPSSPPPPSAIAAAAVALTAATLTSSAATITIAAATITIASATLALTAAPVSPADDECRRV